MYKIKIFIYTNIVITITLFIINSLQLKGIYLLDDNVSESFKKTYFIKKRKNNANDRNRKKK